jgi:hypothetical protein
MKEKFVVEFSPSQKAFHIQPLLDAVEANQRRFWHKPLDMFDWVPVFVGSRKQCELIVVQSERRLERETEDLAWTH